MPRSLLWSPRASPPPLDAQQVPDTAFVPPIGRPSFAAGKGPTLCLDEAHHNFHTLDGGARQDGFNVVASRRQFDASALAECRVFVISNAKPNDDEWNTYPTPTPSAFSDVEIAAMRKWVEGGGPLLLIADHMPLAGAAARLAAEFGRTRSS